MRFWPGQIGPIDLLSEASSSVRFLQARSATDAANLFGASPTALFQYEDGATTTTDLVGGSMTLTAAGGADRIASSIAGNAARIANDSTQYWGAGDTADLDVTTGAFAIAGVMTLPSLPAADSWAWLRYLEFSRGFGIHITTAGHLAFYTFEPGAVAATIASSHVGSAFGFIVGRSVTNLRLYAETTIGSASAVIASAETLTGAARLAAPGRHQVDAGAGAVVGTVLDGWAFFSGAAAETVLANRASLVGRLKA